LVEFKASFDWSTHRNERDPSLRLGTLRTLCAFLNCEGGSVYLGVDDSGSVVGIDDELLRFNCDNPRDQFETRVRQYVREAIDPPPLGALDIEFETYGRRTVCVLSVAPRPGITYLVQRKPSGRIEDIVYVRDGNRTVRLEGRSRDRFVIARCAPSP
jgi:predicted HTH transcriptional regulator